MRIVIYLSILASVYAATGRQAERNTDKVTIGEAKTLVMASVADRQRRLPQLEAEQYDAPAGSRFLFFTVTWEGTPHGSVVVGNYAVDPYTGDVFSATVSCYEEKNRKLQAVQQQIRAHLHLSHLQYRRLKTKGPLCEK